MMALSERKTRLIFETDDTVRERGKSRSVVIEARPRYAVVHLKGTRTRFTASWDAIYHLAARIEADRLRREKAEAKKTKKGGSR